MAVIKRFVVSGDIEKRIIIGMITNDNFCLQIYKMAKKQYFKIDYARIVFQWISEYYKRFKKSPNKEIQNIFSIEQENLKEADAELIKVFLSELSRKFEEDEIVNYEYLIDQSRNYFRERALSILAEKIQGELSRGRIQDAENEIKEFSNVSKDISQWFNPFAQENIKQIFSESDDDYLFSLPKPLDKMAGVFERDWLIAFMAPMKRGKSWMLQEFAIHALSLRLRVAYFSFEMNKKSVSKRIYKRLVNLAMRPGEYFVPVFDCERNQDNTCKKKERSCFIGIKSPGTQTPKEWKNVKGYRVCVACRNGQISKSESEEIQEYKTDYIYSTWWDKSNQVKEFAYGTVKNKVKHFKIMHGDNLRIMAYPAFSASFEDAENDLDELEQNEGFIPDVICYDYFDISNPGKGTSGLSDRAKADHVWMQGKALAAKRHCLVATVLQSNRKSISKTSLEQEDTSEDIRKLAHVDILFGLNQTPEEKEMGVIRISVVAHRHEEFDFKGEAVVLQSLLFGQPFIDAEYIKEVKKIEN